MSVSTFEQEAELVPVSVTQAKPKWRLVEAAELAVPLPPVPYLVQHLDLCPGAPLLVAGYGYSGKTLAMQSLALSIASGRPAWGAWSIGRRGRVVHVDCEQGQRLTAERYQRLAYGMDERLADLPIATIHFPNVSLLTDEGRAMLLEVSRGAELVLVDSLRACVPGVDENSSEVREVLDVMTSVSEITKACFAVVHHAKKPSGDGFGAKFSIRGSSAIFDACGSVLVFSGDKGQATDVTHEKARTSGITADDFSLDKIDVDGRVGLRVEVSGTTRVQRIEAMVEATTQAQLDTLEAFIASNPGCSQRQLRGAAIVPERQLMKALGRLETEGRAHVQRRPGKGGGEAWHPGSPPELVTPNRSVTSSRSAQHPGITAEAHDAEPVTAAVPGGEAVSPLPDDAQTPGITTEAPFTVLVTPSETVTSSTRLETDDSRPQPSTSPVVAACRRKAKTTTKKASTSTTKPGRRPPTRARTTPTKGDDKSDVDEVTA